MMIKCVKTSFCWQRQESIQYMISTEHSPWHAMMVIARTGQVFSHRWLHCIATHNQDKVQRHKITQKTNHNAKHVDSSFTDHVPLLAHTYNHKAMTNNIYILNTNTNAINSWHAWHEVFPVQPTKLPPVHTQILTILCGQHCQIHNDRQIRDKGTHMKCTMSHMLLSAKRRCTNSVVQYEQHESQWTEYSSRHAW